MTSHRLHPITGPWPYTLDPRRDDLGGATLAARVPTEDSKIYDDPDDAVLFDGCERCEQHARDLVSLDADKFAALWRRMVEVERDAPDYTAAYRTKAEATVGLALYRMAILIERHDAGIYPWTWPWVSTGDGVPLTSRMA